MGYCTNYWKEEHGRRSMVSSCIYKIMNRSAILADCSDQHLCDMTMLIGLYINRHQRWFSTTKRPQNPAGKSNLANFTQS